MEYNGYIAGFPPEIVELMLKRMEEQGMGRDISILESSPMGAFSFGRTPEGHSFWHKIITYKKLELFYELYPFLKSSTLNYIAWE